MKKVFLNILFVFCLLSVPAALYAQIITTVAGGATGHGVYWGDGGPATDATLQIFGGLAVDRVGNIFIADVHNQRIRKVDATTGIITTVAGTGVAGYNGDGISATTAQLNYPSIVIVDSTGNFYIGDINNNRIRKVDITTGIITTFAGNGIYGFCGDSGLASAANYDFSAFTFDVFGNMIFESNHHRICKIDPTGLISVVAGTGVAGNSGDGGAATSATMSPNAYGICTDRYGNIYFSDSFKSVRKINVSTGIITRVAGTGDGIGSPYPGDGGMATASIIDPVSTVVDDSGNLYIDDETSSRILKVNILGVIYTIAGDGTHGYSGDSGSATAAEINYPENIALDVCGNVYIADFNNARVRKVTYPPTPITLTNSISALIAAVCAGTSTTYTAAASTSSGAITYQWYVNGTPIPGATASTYNYIPAEADSIRCIATATSPCTSAVTSSNSIIMSVTPISTPTITVTAPAAAAVGSIVTVNATVAGAGSGYGIDWYNNSMLFSTTATPTTTYTKAAGTDHITATVVPGEGCYDSSTSAVSTVMASTNNISNIVLPRFEIYPNPVKNILYVASSMPEAKYKILSAVGNVLLQGVLDQGNNSIDVKGLPTAVYMLRIESAGQQFSNFQIISR